VTPTNGRTPRTGERQLRVKYRCGVVSKHTYTAAQMRWNHKGCDWDIVAVERA
jgi:hypothetical protein